MSDFKVIETQEDLDAIIKNRLERESKKFAEKYADYEDLKNRSTDYEARIATLTDELTKANEAIAGHESEVNSLNEKIKGFETRDLKVRLAREVGLDYDLAERITGTDEASMKADAEVLAKAFKASHPQPLATNEQKPMSDRDMALKSVLDGLKGD